MAQPSLGGDRRGGLDDPPQRPEQDDHVLVDQVGADRPGLLGPGQQ